MANPQNRWLKEKRCLLAIYLYIRYSNHSAAQSLSRTENVWYYCACTHKRGSDSVLVTHNSSFAWRRLITASDSADLEPYTSVCCTEAVRNYSVKRFDHNSLGRTDVDTSDFCTNTITCTGVLCSVLCYDGKPEIEFMSQ